MGTRYSCAIDLFAFAASYIDRNISAEKMIVMQILSNRKTSYCDSKMADVNACLFSAIFSVTKGQHHLKIVERITIVVCSLELHLENSDIHLISVVSIPDTQFL